MQNQTVVYLFALMDCSGFKVGFSCNPLQRIHTFSRRYFERFDVHQSWLLELETIADARAIEAALKTELDEFRIDAPSWVPAEAGGHTEWFSAVHFARAEDRLRSFLTVHGSARVDCTADVFRAELERQSRNFESWAWSQAQHVGDARTPAAAHVSMDAARSLRDWLDAYRYFDVPLFVDDPTVMQFVRESVRHVA